MAVLEGLRSWPSASRGHAARAHADLTIVGGHAASEVKRVDHGLWWGRRWDGRGTSGVCLQKATRTRLEYSLPNGGRRIQSVARPSRAYDTAAVVCSAAPLTSTASIGTEIVPLNDQSVPWRSRSGGGRPTSS